MLRRNMKLRQFYDYVVSNKYRKVLYIGMTNNLSRRLAEHAAGTVKSFTCQYNLTYLLYFEVWDDAPSDIAREKQLRNWHREWKFSLIKELNPGLKDHYGLLR